MDAHERDTRYVQTFLARVGEVWRGEPDTRFGQFVSNIVWVFPDRVDTDPGAGDISDEGFLRALEASVADRRKRREELERKRREGREDPVDPRIMEGVKQTQRTYDRWALERFGRIGRDPARIGPFLSVLGQAWLERPDLRFGELIAGVLPRGVDPDDPDRRVGGGLRGLRIIEDDAFLELLEHRGVLSAEEISERYVHRGPLGDLLEGLESPDER